MEFLDAVLHLDQFLTAWIGWMGPWSYVLLFSVVFLETALILTPFLLGDSLLFAVGALSAIEGSPLSLPLITALLIAAAFLGDSTNYTIGRSIGPKLLQLKNGRFVNPKHLAATERFYERHGGKTIVLARFVPIIRTFAPFVAGLGRMAPRKFSLFNILGAVLWVVPLVIAGFYFGNLPVVKENFHLIVMGIIVVSLVPAIVQGVRGLTLRHGESY